MEYRHLTRYANRKFDNDGQDSLQIILATQHKVLVNTMTMDPKATYGRIVADYFPHKEDPYCTCLTVGVNLINYPGNVGTSTA